MKRSLIFISALLCAAISCACAFDDTREKQSGGHSGQDNFTSQLGGEMQTETSQREGFKRAVWVSYIELQELICSDENEFEARLNEMLDNLATIKTTDVYLQVRAFGEALYASESFPSAALLYSGYNENIDYLAKIISEAKKRGIRLHAWINPYRLGDVGGDYSELAESLRMLDENAVVSLEIGSFINPASAAAREIIVSDIKQLCESYDIDGVQFDDYFYPFTDLETDASLYESYRAEGGELSLESWRRDNVSKLVKAAFEAVHESGKGRVFGISPDASIERNMTRHFADVELWCREEGYIDYICPQIYYGYENETRPFEAAVGEWKALCTAPELIIGLSAYKTGREDAYAGSGSGEWQENFNIVSRQYSDALNDGEISGVAIFRYGSLFAPEESVEAFANLELYALQRAAGGGE